MNVALVPFIVGSGRSGTTLLRAMLDSHPALTIPPEAPFITRIATASLRNGDERRFSHDSFIEQLSRDERFAGWGIPIQLVGEVLGSRHVDNVADAIRILQELYANSEGKPTCGDKTPGSVMAIDVLARLLPEARFVHIVRDGRDVALSYLDVRFGPNDILGAGMLWKRRVNRGRRLGRALEAGRYVEVAYEELVERPEETLATVCAFIGLEFQGEMLRYVERADRYLVSAPYQSHLRSSPTHTRDWRRDMTLHDRRLFESVAKKTLDAFGYETLPRIPPTMRASAWAAEARWLSDKVVRRAHTALRSA